MFYGSQFNGDLSKWNVSNVVDMRYMFKNSQFTGDISKCNLSYVFYTEDMFYGTPTNINILKSIVIHNGLHLDF